MERIVLLDTSAIMYRAFYANPHFRTKNEPTGAIYGFTLMLQKIIKEFSPKMVGAAFDVSRSTLKRTEAYTEYKAQRDAAPEDLISQIPRIEQLLEYYGIAKFKIPGHEADDVLGTLAKKFSTEGYEVIVVTGDKDLSQIICEGKNIKIALLGKGDGKDPFKMVVTPEDVHETLGVYPCQIPDFFGLIGDTSDGIPGVRKIGPKKAAPMIELYNNLEGIYENIDKLTEIPGVGKSLIQNLIEDKELAFLSRKLATIEDDLQELKDVKVEELETRDNPEKLLEFFKELEFKAMIKKYTTEESVEDSKGGLFKNHDSFQSENENNKSSENNFEDSKNSKNSEKEILNINLEKYKNIIVNSKEIFENLKDKIKSENKIVFYLDKTGCSISTRDENFYFPNIFEKRVFQERKVENMSLFSMGTQMGNESCNGVEDLTREENWFKEIFQMTDIKKVISYDTKNLYHFGIELNEAVEVFDTLIAYHLITAKTKNEIEVYATEFTDVNLKTYKDIFGKLEVKDIVSNSSGGNLNSNEDLELKDNLGIDKLAKYLGDRSRVIYETSEFLEKRVNELELKSVMDSIETPLVKILADMEINGIKIDIDFFMGLNLEFNKKLEEIKEKLYIVAGHGDRKEFNLNSPKQLAEILFVELSLPIIKKNKTGPSTDVDVLEELRDQGYEIADLLLEHRKLSKLVQTYVEPLPKLVDGKARLHSSFNQIGTATGRLSSSNPNLQNIPVKSDEGQRIRTGFIAEKGKKFIGIDYSQIELRVLAEVTQDENLVKAYKEGHDLHEMTARKIFEVKDEDSVTREQRTVAKIVNFSLIYGKTAFGLAKELKIPNKDAAHYIKTYFEQYPKVKVFEKECIESAEELGYVKTMFGRRREIEGINSKNKNIKQQGERMAVNTVIQGTAAEIIKKAMINIYSEIKDKNDIKLILQVHDELIFEVDEDKAQYYKERMEKLMKEAVVFKYSKIDVNGSIGDNWGETK